MREHAYAAHEILVAPARLRPQLWRLIAGLVLVAAVTLVPNQVMHQVLAGTAAGSRGGAQLGTTPGSMLVLLGGFVFMTLGTFLAALLLHQRDPRGVIGPLRRAVIQFWQVFRFVVILGVVLLVLPPYGMDEPLRRNLHLDHWLFLLPFSLTAVLIQSSAEEILFRGYIQQSLAARWNSPLVWMGVPATLFALGHYVPAEAGDNALIVAAWSGLFGVLMADLTARAGTLGPAIAIHMFNNVTALLIFSMPESLNGLSLYILPFEMSGTGETRLWLAVDFGLMILTWLAARIAIRR